MPLGWIWDKKSQREIQKLKAQYDKDVSTKVAAKQELELELVKERERVKDYQQALISQSQQMVK